MSDELETGQPLEPGPAAASPGNEPNRLRPVPIAEHAPIAGHAPDPNPLSVLGKFTWFLAFMVVLLLSRFVLPRMVEEIQYGIARGRQRAEYEGAKESLARLPLEELSRAYQSISQRIGPSVVHINVTNFDRSGADDEFSYLLKRRRRESSGQGSGVIIDSTGYIVTNNHVIEGATTIEVSLSDGRRVDAIVVGRDVPTDIAVLRIQAEQLIPAEWGDSDQVESGAMVWAVGSPFGLERSITSGILSAKNRGGRFGSALQDFLQTDAAINPGNSGGPLVDVSGKVIGITTAIVGEAYQGIGFAVPSSVARDVYERIRMNGRVSRGWLGVGLDALTPERVAALRLPSAEGAYIAGLTIDQGIPSPAYQAGIRVGDVIVSWNGHKIRSPEELIRMVSRTDVGATAEVVVLRDGKELTLKVMVGERNDQMR